MISAGPGAPRTSGTPLSDTFWPRKINAAQRLVMRHLMSGWLPLYLVTEYPKSGGSWVSQMLSDYFDVPFPRDRRPRLESCVLHGHFLPGPGLRNVCCVLRDGRDVMVSAYYHRLFQHERSGPKLIARNRSRVPFGNYDDVRANLPAFIRYMFETESKGAWHFRWDEFVDSWAGTGVPIVHYERLLADTPDALGAAIGELTGEAPDRDRLDVIARKYSFENLAQRKAGEEDARSFLRKGIAGDWKAKFTREAAEVFDHYAGRTLIDLGYEANRGWIAEQPAA